ncbi:hypothetical protein JAAARDRAFT_208733 [Jaapia argillacea MUCL 33604]|uniref:non-specific serine/threonine protein kinase n=1 Tax=Jaapia argillacea MUCL 33604 TaxID=933084 RepID=A0A067PKR1_9AGAM|nr:hypothetical protein JAAARDRAFT_208733 [Jaapia argillacea MUCL 33604]
MSPTPFHYNADNVEDVLLYKPGGFHPVHFGDTFSTIADTAHPRYRVVHKLGYGGFATVWLAQDLANNNHAVAMKIIIADRRSSEVELLRYMDAQPPHPARKHALELLDHFQIVGPNGTHDVLITEVLLPLTTLEGLHLLTPKRAAHDNIAFKVPAFDKLTADEWLMGLPWPEVAVIFPRDIEEPSIIQSRPRYVVQPTEIHEFVKPYVKAEKDVLSAVIIDFGNACLPSDPSSMVCTPLYYRPPEFVIERTKIQDLKSRSRGDIWSLGCTVYEVVTGVPLFYLNGTGEAFLRAIEQKIGQPTGRDGKWITNQDNTSPGTWKLDFKDKQFEDLMRQMLQVDPNDRTPVKDLINHPWFGDLRPGSHGM